MCLTDAPQKTHLIADILGDPTWHVIANVFAEVAWVEEEIAAAKARWPEHAAHIDRLFGLRLYCAVLPGHWAEPLARIHIRELAHRVVEGKDLRPPTRAEMLYVLSDLSQEAPFRPAAFVLFARLFREAFPEQADQVLGDVLPAYEHTVQEDDVQALQGELMRKLYQPRRVLDA